MEVVTQIGDAIGLPILVGKFDDPEKLTFEIVSMNEPFKKHFSSLETSLKEKSLYFLLKEKHKEIIEIIKSGKHFFVTEITLYDQNLGESPAFIVIITQPEGIYFVLVFFEFVVSLKSRLKILKEVNTELQLLITLLRHDLKNALFFATNALELLKKTNDLSVIPRIEQKLAEANSIVAKITLFQKLAYKQELKYLDLNKIIVDVLNSFPIDGYSIEFLDKKVLCDEFVRSVFLNIISNSVKHNPNKIRIDISFFENEDYIIVAIKDNGKGLINTDPSMFYPEYSFNGNINSSVLDKSHVGFFLISEIMKRYGGFFVVNNSEIGGVVTVLYFPKKSPNIVSI